MIVAAVGLQREARLLATPGVAFVIGGGDAERLEAQLETLATTATAFMSLGIAGALSPVLRPGDWVVGSEVRDGHASTATDPRWTARLASSLLTTPGPVCGTAAPVATAASKAALHATTGALAVDMESHVLARVAARHGKPCAVARAISDVADASLPPAALVGMRTDGGIDLPAVLRSLVTRPAQLPALIATGIAAERGLHALSRFPRDLLAPPAAA